MPPTTTTWTARHLTASVRTAGLGLTGLALATCGALGTAGTSQAASASPAHIPATALSARALAAETCAISGTADDAVLRIMKAQADARKVTATVRLAAFETAWVESHANSLPCGDADSEGVFQQRPSMGWGSSAQVQDPAYAVNKFLDQAIPVAAKNPSWSAGKVAQAVQRSAFPSRYDQVQGTAQALINRSSSMASGAIHGGQFTWPQVQSGERNNRVIALQYLLKRAGSGIAVDGSFGPATRAAVINFQKTHGLVADGLVGPNTWNKLIYTVTPGLKSYAVSAAQTMLRVHGYTSVKVTGTSDAATVQAIQTFRKGHRLPAATTVDAGVWNTLISIRR